MKRLITVTALLLLIATSLISQLGCGTSENGTDLQTTTTSHAIDWVNFIKFNDITYLSKRAVEVSFADEDLLYFDEIKFKVAGNINEPGYRSKNGDAAFLEEGTPIYSMRGYSPDFRLVAKTETETILYEADTNPYAKTGADLLDISGKVEYIGINSAVDGTTELASIKEEGLVSQLVEMILEAPVDQTFRSHEGKQYFIAFYLNDGTVVKRSYYIRSGDLSRGIMLPAEIGEIIDSITAVEMEAADEIVITPGGYMYRANFHQQGVANPWLPIETVEIPLDNNSNTAYLRYRQYIVTEPGETRNNIIIVRTPENLDTGELNLSIANINTGIEVVQGKKWSGPGVRSIVLAITTSSDIQPGEYIFKIGIEIEGLDYGTYPCTINTMPGTFHSFLELSAFQVTLEEAEEVIGLAVPVPAYLPANYEIQEIYAYGDEIIFLISDEEVNKELLDHTDAGGERQRYEFRCRIIITVRWIDDGFYIPPHKIPGTVVDINEGSGKITPLMDRNDLRYYHQPYPDDVGVFKFIISANKSLSDEELVKIAESMVYTPLPTSPLPTRDWEQGSTPPAGIEGLSQPALLTEDEKAEVIKIALNSQRVSEWLQKRTDYRTGLVDWYAIIWDSEGEAGIWWSLEYDRIANEGVPGFVNPYAFWYPGVTIAVGEGTIYQMQIAVDLNSGKIAMAMGPYPSLSSPDRFKNFPTPSSPSVSTPIAIPSHEGSPIISMSIDHLMQGKSSRLAIYEDGYVTQSEETGLRPPISEQPPMRSWYTGQLSKDEITDLIDLFQSSGFLNMNDTYKFAGKPIDNGGMAYGDNFVTIAFIYGDLQKIVSAKVYLTYEDMPLPLNDIYTRLWGIALDTSFITSEVVSYIDNTYIGE